MTDKTNVITVSGENLTWINNTVPGKSKKERLENILRFYQSNGGPRLAQCPSNQSANGATS
jgi:hypothetical protein